MGLAVAGDADRIGRIGEFAARSSSPVYADVITPLCEGFAAVVEDRPADAIEPLTRVVSSLPELGGSAAQQEVVTETLVRPIRDFNRYLALLHLMMDYTEFRKGIRDEPPTCGECGVRWSYGDSGWAVHIDCDDEIERRRKPGRRSS